MGSFEKLKKKIDLNNNLKSVIKTMKALAAVNIKQFEKSSFSLSAYSNIIESGLQGVLHNMPVYKSDFEAGKNRLYVIIGSDHGLCGKFNETISDYAIGQIKNIPHNQSCKIIVAGLKIHRLLQEAGYIAEKLFPVPGSLNHVNSLVQEILIEWDQIKKEFHIGNLYVISGHISNANQITPENKKLFPPDTKWLNQLKEKKWDSSSLPMSRMDDKNLLAALIKEYLYITLYRSITDSLTAENSSRLVTMQKAEKNITSHLEELEKQYQQTRQTAITAELLEILSGYEIQKK